MLINSKFRGNNFQVLLRFPIVLTENVITSRTRTVFRKLGSCSGSSFYVCPTLRFVLNVCPTSFVLNVCLTYVLRALRVKARALTRKASVRVRGRVRFSLCLAWFTKVLPKLFPRSS